MKITGIETYIAGNPWKNWVFVVVRTDEGLHGVGEGTLNLFSKTVATAVEEMRQLVIGMDPHDIEAITTRMLRDPFTDGGQIQRAACAAVEAACWDIIGKAAGKPVYKLLGGQVRHRVRAYANGWYQGERKPENFAERAQDVAKRGYTALKFDPFGSASKIMERYDEDLSIDIIAAVRDAVGPKVDLCIEGHCRFSVHQAIRIAQRIAEYDPLWFEEPVPHRGMDALVRVAQASPVNIATGESFNTLQDFGELMATGAVHILQPELLSLGGIWITRQVCSLVDAFHGVVAPHNAQGPVSTAMAVQLAGCVPNYLIQEFFDEFNVGWSSEVVRYEVKFEDGDLIIPDTPGLGVELNIEALAKYPYHPGNYLPLFESGWESRKGKSGE